MTSLDDLVNFLNQLLNAEKFEHDLNGMYHTSKRPIQRLGLALEANFDLAQWINDHQLDALFLHRPWALKLTELPDDIGIVAYHLSFDEQLTLGYNPWLAIALNLSNVEILGYKNERPIGMVGNILPLSFEKLLQHIDQIFQGYDLAHVDNSNINSQINRVAIVGAMTEPLIREASDRGVQVYITGQFRKPAALAVEETKLGIITVGHQRSEEWGLRMLANLLQSHWATLEITIYLTSSRESH